MGYFLSRSEAETEQGFAQLVPQSGKVRVYPAWQPIPKRPLPEPAPPLFSRSNMRVVGFEVGEDRRPPNRSRHISPPNIPLPARPV
jgi:hypothetical protein